MSHPYRASQVRNPVVPDKGPLWPKVDRLLFVSLAPAIPWMLGGWILGTTFMLWVFTH